MLNETCVETQTSEVLTRVAFLFISILCLKSNGYKQHDADSATGMKFKVISLEC